MTHAATCYNGDLFDTMNSPRGAESIHQIQQVSDITDHLPYPLPDALTNLQTLLQNRNPANQDRNYNLASSFYKQRESITLHLILKTVRYQGNTTHVSEYETYRFS
jgi:hypothetical protein